MIRKELTRRFFLQGSGTVAGGALLRAGVPAFIARHALPHVSILNAGESDMSHPTQGLLDVLTIRQCKGEFESLSVAIVGDIRHSRVAMSATHALTTLGVGDLRLISPPVLAPDADSNGQILKCALALTYGQDIEEALCRVGYV